jgi:acyl dehydratase
MPRYLDEFSVGQTEAFGSYKVSREEVIEFASRYDPQPFHLDDAAAAANPIFGRVAASGWHTTAMAMRMLVDHGRQSGGFSLGSPGADEIRWLRPVYPGDTLRTETEVIEIRGSKSRPEIGSIKFRIALFNQHDEQVLSMVAINLMPRRR